MKLVAYESLQALPSEVCDAFSYSRVRNFFSSIEWFKCLSETVFGTQDARVYVASSDQGATIGLTICCRQGTTSALRSFTNYYTGEYRPVIVANGTPPVYEVVEQLAKERPRWSSIELDYLRSDRDDAAEATRALEAANFMVERTRRYENWFLPVAGASFREFYDTRPSQMRNTIARREKKLLKSHRVDIRVVTAPSDDLGRAVADYVTVYNSSWKVPEPYPRYIPALVQTCAELGILRLGILYVDSVPAAAQLWITHGDAALIYKLAYDERFSDFSVGSILSREMFKTAIDNDKVREIDYGVGSEKYKRDWMSDVRHFERISALNLVHPLGLIGACGVTAKSLVKKLVRARGTPESV